MNQPQRNNQNKHWRRPPMPPDVLYHATTMDRLEHYKNQNKVRHGRGKFIFLSRTESHAWQVAHRFKSGDPIVLYVDVPRARRAGVKFKRNRQGLWQSTDIDLKHILNLQPGFQVQVSAGGLPCYFGESPPKLALIQVKRPFSNTWEVAKGKLEVGETPPQAACREVCEEMGCEMDLQIVKSLGVIRFGFYTPEREPRLKSLHLYLMKTPHMDVVFEPANAEGIIGVGWLTPGEALKRVTHRSLKPIFKNIVRIFKEDKLKVEQE